MLQTPGIQICPNTVLLFELRMRHPALRVIINIKNNFKNNEKTNLKASGLKKLNFSKIFEFIKFFSINVQNSYEISSGGPAGRAAAEIFLKISVFLQFSIKFLIFFWKNQKFHFFQIFERQCANFVRSFTLDKVYKLKIPCG